MHLLFVDESGTPPPPDKTDSQPHFVLGGIIVPEEVWPKLTSDLNRAKARHGVVGEIKWRYFSPARGGKPHSLSHLTDDEKGLLRTELFEAVAKYRSVRVIAAVVDTAAAYRHWPSLKSDDDLYHLAFKQLSERFQYFLQDLERISGQSTRGLIVSDNRNNDQDSRLKEFHQSLLAGGSFTSGYANLVEGLFIAASHHSPGTQFADLVAGAIFRSEFRGDSRFYDQIAASVRRGPNGQVAGYGLVYIPKK
ncbi:DUF3800 domain-containing protein [Demequina sp.]|uniref:DUF3800 domain-containing protein n=1 Tax=Demequina sp. TaxID=2050685 RepID=UPI003D120E37